MTQVSKIECYFLILQLGMGCCGNKLKPWENPVVFACFIFLEYFLVLVLCFDCVCVCVCGHVHANSMG